MLEATQYYNPCYTEPSKKGGPDFSEIPLSDLWLNSIARIKSGLGFWIVVGGLGYRV